MDRVQSIAFLQPLATECLGAWTRNDAEPQPKVDFQVWFTEKQNGRRDFFDGVSLHFFNHCLLLLNNMTCWQEGEVERPWEVRVSFQLPKQSTVDPVPAGADIEIRTDDKAETADVSVTRTRICHNLAVGKQSHLVGSFRLRTTYPGIRHINPDTEYTSCVVEQQKILTYHSLFTWEYHFYVRWSFPMARIEENLDDNRTELVFTKPPTYHIAVTCSAFKDCKDPRYLAEDMFCKLWDFVPPPFRYEPVQLHVDTSAQSIAFVSEETEAEATEASEGDANTCG